ncbi:MAG: ABC transporter ATP-binding protein/permease [Actinomycetota bacterium]|nr:ABC transporter ATP-binding protein/permease [Actinomycetota bacterium]
MAGLFRPYRWQVVAVVALILLSSGIGIVNPLLIKVVFDRALFCGPGCPDLGLLYQLVALMVALPVVGAVVGVGQTYLANVVGQRVMQDLRTRLYAHLQDMSLRFFTATRTGEIQSRLANDVGGVQTVVTETASTILSNSVVVVSTVIAMVVISWQLTLVSLFIVPVFVILTGRAGRARRRIAESTQESLAEMTAITQETLSVSGILLSKVFGRGRDEVDRFRQENRRLADLQVRQQMVGRAFFAIVGTFFAITPALVYLVAGHVLNGGATPGISAGTIVAFTTLQTRLFFPVGQLLEVSVNLQSSLALFQRIFEYLDLPRDVVDAPVARDLPKSAARGAIRLRDVSFRYDVAFPDHPDGRGGDAAGWALRGVSLEIAPGQLAAVVGPSGAGKTTLSYLVPRLYEVTGGTVEIDGVDVRAITLASLARIVGMVTQESYLLHASVRQNLLYARPDASDDELEAAARAAFIHDRVMELSDGYDTVVGERGYRLSGGEKQRLTIARVILKDPRILILDEATSALDTASERLVQTALRPLMAGRTTIAIAHRLSTVLAADVIFVLDRGRLVERGTHQELLAAGGLYAELYHQQFQGGLVEARCQDGFVLSSGAILTR